MAATTQSSLRSPIPNHHAHQSNNTAVAHSQLPPHHQPSQPRRNPSSKQKFLLEFSQCLVDFVVQLLPTIEELAVKEDVRKLLERLIRTIEPESRLLSFGSTANGFSLRNSGPSTHTLVAFLCGGLVDTPIPDMDLCCLIDSDERTTASNLVTLLGDLLERGKLPRPNSTLRVTHPVTPRNQVSRQAAASCSDTYRQTDPRSLTRTAVWHCLRYRLRKQTCPGEHASAYVLRHDRPCQSPNHGALPYVYLFLGILSAKDVTCAVKVWSKRRCVIPNSSAFRSHPLPPGGSIHLIKEPCPPTVMFCWFYISLSMSRTLLYYQTCSRCRPSDRSRR